MGKGFYASMASSQLTNPTQEIIFQVQLRDILIFSPILEIMTIAYIQAAH